MDLKTFDDQLYASFLNTDTLCFINLLVSSFSTNGMHSLLCISKSNVNKSNTFLKTILVAPNTKVTVWYLILNWYIWFANGYWLRRASLLASEIHSLPCGQNYYSVTAGDENKKHGYAATNETCSKLEREVTPPSRGCKTTWSANKGMRLHTNQHVELLLVEIRWIWYQIWCRCLLALFWTS